MPRKKTGATKSSKTVSRNYGETQIERLDNSLRPSNRNIPGDAELQVTKIHTYSKARTYTDNNTELPTLKDEQYSGEHWTIELPLPCGDQNCVTDWDSLVTTHRVYDFDVSAFLHPPIIRGKMADDSVLATNTAAYFGQQGNMEDSADLLSGGKNVMFVITKTNSQAKYNKSENPYVDAENIHQYLCVRDDTEPEGAPTGTSTMPFITFCHFQRVCYAFNPLYACFYEYIPHGVTDINDQKSQMITCEGHFRIHEYRRNDDSTNDYAVDRLTDAYVLSMFVPQGYSMSGSFKKMFGPWRKAEITVQAWYRTVKTKASTLYLQNVDMFSIKDLDDVYTTKMGDKIASDGWTNTGSIKGNNKINVSPTNVHIGVNEGIGKTYDKTTGFDLNSEGPWA